MLRSLICVVLLAFFAASPVSAQGFADENRDWGITAVTQIRLPPYTAPTPRDIPGGKTILTQDLRALLGAEVKPVLIDVASGMVI